VYSCVWHRERLVSMLLREGMGEPKMRPHLEAMQYVLATSVAEWVHTI